MSVCVGEEIKTKLDYLANKYETASFVENDPVMFVHKFKIKEDVEIAGFIASLFAFGKRELFIKKLDEFFKMADYKPYEYIIKGDFSKVKNESFNYRFIKPDDMVELLNILNILYLQDGGLEKLFEKGYKSSNGDLSMVFKTVVEYFYSRVKNQVGQGFYFMLPNPNNNGAMKRLCMYLRWMVRKSVVDVGIWKFMTPTELLIPLDVHVGRIARELGILSRKANDFKSVIEITEYLKKLCPEDPIKYDFALFGYGVNR